jgi:anti-sigma factor RsiW
VADDLDAHADHDPMAIAALLDGETAGFERTVGESRIASCPACAALLDDLLALSTATRAMPTPTRLRDFTLTAADAVRLSAEVAAEPGHALARLPGVMTDPRAAAAHASHDTMLVASLADHSLASAERIAAEAQVAACGPCAEIYADLMALRAATKAMPTPTRPRDFALSSDDAARLRPGGWRRLVAAFGTSRDLLSRPLAVGLTSLGLAGLLVSSVPSMLSGSAASAPTAVSGGATGATSVEAAPGSPRTLQDTGVGAAAIPSGAGGSGQALSPVGAPVSTPAPAVAAASPGSGDYGAVKGVWQSPTPGDQAILNSTASGAAGATQGPSTFDASSETNLTGATGIPTLVFLSAAFLIAGLGLFIFRWSARRLGDG